MGVYFQDDWRATDTLTLNLGVRWEYHTPLYEVNDRQSNFSPFTGELQLPGENGNSRALCNGFWKDWQPRIGFAWTPEFLGGKKTVLRGAYTVSSFMEGTGTNLRMPLNPPFNVEFETIYDSPAGLQTPQSTNSQGLTVLQQLDPFRNGRTQRSVCPEVLFLSLVFGDSQQGVGPDNGPAPFFRLTPEPAITARRDARGSDSG